MIGHILDSQSSPVKHGRHFLSQLANAAPSFAMRGERRPWGGAEDTAFVFRETFKAAPSDAQKAYDAILDYARKRPIVKAMTADCSNAFFFVASSPAVPRPSPDAHHGD